MKILIKLSALIILLGGLLLPLSAVRYTDCNYPNFWYAIKDGNVKEYKKLATKKSIEAIKYKCKYDNWKEEHIKHGVMEAVSAVFAPGDTWLEILEHMLSLGADPNAKFKEYKTDAPIVELALQAARRDYRKASAVKAAKMLIAKGADVKVKTLNNTALHWAASGNLKELVELLLKNGADKNIKDNEGHTAADWAEQNGHIEMANFLRGKSNDDYRNSIFYFVKNKNLDQVKKLTNSQKNKSQKLTLLNKPEAHNNRTPLYYAAENGSFEIVKFLVENGADVNVITEGGTNALRVAVTSGHKEIAKYLINKDSKLNVTQTAGCATGYTVLNWAVINGWEDIVGLMLDKGADVVRASEREYLLITARHSLSMIKFLISRGVELNQETIQYFEDSVAKNDTTEKWWLEHAKKVLAYLKSLPAPVSSKVMAKAEIKQNQPMARFENIDVNDERELREMAKRKK